MATHNAAREKLLRPAIDHAHFGKRLSAADDQDEFMPKFTKAWRTAGFSARRILFIGHAR